MDYKDRAENVLQNLKNIEENTNLTDGHKQIINFTFKLSSDCPDTPYAEVYGEDDYHLITKYIISKFNNPNFVFHKDTFPSNKMYLYLFV